MESEKVLQKLDTAFISVQGFDDFKPTEHNIQVMAVVLSALKAAYQHIKENRVAIDKNNENGESAVPVLETKENVRPDMVPLSGPICPVQNTPQDS